MAKRYSANIELRMFIGSLMIPLAQLGPSFAILKEADVEFSDGTQARIDVIVQSLGTGEYNCQRTV